MDRNNRNFVGSLRDPKVALEDINLVLKTQTRADFLFLLHNIAIAQGFAKIAEEAGLSREGLYKMLDPNGNPRLNILMQILGAMGFELRVAQVNESFRCKNSGVFVRPNSLAQVYPALATQWHPTKNDKLTPNDITPRSRRMVWWKCSTKESHEWAATTSNLIKNFKSDFLSGGIYTKEAFAQILKRACPYCIQTRNDNE